MLGLDSGRVEQPEADDGDLGVLRDGLEHVEQHCGCVVDEVSLRKLQQFLISDELDLP